MNLLTKMIEQQGLSEEDTKTLLAQLLEFTLMVKEMRTAQRKFYKDKILARQWAYKNMLNKEYKVDTFLRQFEEQ